MVKAAIPDPAVVAHTTPDATPPTPLPSHHTPAATSASASPAMSKDPLVARVAAAIAAAVNDFKRELDKRDGTWAKAHGTLELAINEAQTWALAIVPDDDGDEYPITVKATLKPDANSHDHVHAAPLAHLSPPATYKPTRCASDTDVECDLVSRKKRKLADSDDTSSKHQRTGYADDEDDSLPLLTKAHLVDLLGKLRDDVQEDTSDCVNHVQRLLRRFREEWHEKSKWDYQQAHVSMQTQAQQTRAPFRNSITSSNHQLPGTSFPSPSTERDDQNTSVPDIVRREAKLISTQIRWVEDCRRVAADVHDKREETWRTSSAGFHDGQRQDRENFQNRILHESGLHSQTLNQILNEVKAIGLYAQSMKWETPTSHLAYPSPAVPTPPAFPTQPGPTSGPTQLGRGGNRPMAPKYATQPNQR